MTLQEVLQRQPTPAEEHLWAMFHREEISYKSVNMHLQTLPTQAPTVISAKQGDAGMVIIAQDKQETRYVIALRHVVFSAMLSAWPYEKATQSVAQALAMLCATGSDVFAMASCMNFDDASLPKTQQLYERTVAGMSEYGNATEVVSISESMQFDHYYYQQTQSSVLALGIVKEEDILPVSTPERADNYVVILVGAPTAEDGFSEDRKYLPDALLGGHLLKAHQALFTALKKKKLLQQIGCQAIGRGGIAIAVMKLVRDYGYGISINIDAIHTDEIDLSIEKIICSETTERYLLVAPRELVDYILQHYNQTFALPVVAPNSCAAIIGEINKSGDFQVYANSQIKIDLPLSILIKNIRTECKVKNKKKKNLESNIIFPEDFNDVLLKLLAHENIACREVLRENFDRKFIDRRVFQPMSDSQYPVYLRHFGVSVAFAQNARYFTIDAYWGAMNAVAEAMRTVAVVGAYPQALTCGFYLSNPEHPYIMGEFSEIVCGVVEACKYFHLKTHPDSSIPVLSHDVCFDHVASVYDESSTIAMISCLGTMRDVRNAVDDCFKQAGSCIFLVGERKDECGGSVYYQLQQQLGAQLPQPDMSELEREVTALTDAIDKKLILSARAISRGGLAVCLANMAIPHGFGVAVKILSELADDRLLFSETGGFILEVMPDHIDAVEDCFLQEQCSLFLIGEVTSSQRLMMQDKIDLSIAFAEEAWRNGLSEKIL